MEDFYLTSPSSPSHVPLLYIVDKAEIEGFAAELIDRFGPLPEEVENLLQVMAIKHLCRAAGVVQHEHRVRGRAAAEGNAADRSPVVLPISQLVSCRGRMRAG